MRPPPRMGAMAVGHRRSRLMLSQEQGGRIPLNVLPPALAGLSTSSSLSPSPSSSPQSLPEAAERPTRRVPARGHVGLLPTAVRACWYPQFHYHAEPWPHASSAVASDLQRTHNMHSAADNDGLRSHWEARLSLALERHHPEEIVLVLAQASCVGLSPTRLVHAWLDSTDRAAAVARLRAIVAALTAVSCGILPAGPPGSSTIDVAPSVTALLACTAPSLAAALSIGVRPFFRFPSGADGSSEAPCWPSPHGHPAAQWYAHLTAMTTTGRGACGAACARTEALRPWSVSWLSAITHAVKQHDLPSTEPLTKTCLLAAISLAPNEKVASELSRRYLAAYAPRSSDNGAEVEPGSDTHHAITAALADVGSALRLFCTRTAVLSTVSRVGDKDEVNPSESLEPTSTSSPSSSSRPLLCTEAAFLAILTAVVEHSATRSEVPLRSAGANPPQTSAFPPPPYAVPPRAPSAPAAPPSPPAAPAAPPAPRAPMTPLSVPAEFFEPSLQESAPVLLDLWLPVSQEETNTNINACDDVDAAVRVSFQAWYLHCLIQTRAYTSVTGILRRAARRAVNTHWLAEALPSTSHQELLRALPPAHQQECDVLPQLSELVLQFMQAELRARVRHTVESARVASSSGTPEVTASALSTLHLSDIELTQAAHVFRALQHHQRRAAPLSVTASAALYGRMIEYLIDCCANARSHEQYSTHVRDLYVLFTIANMDALASSLVPGDVPLPAVMIAQPDPRRTEKVRDLVKAFRSAVEYLCESPLLLPVAQAEDARHNDAHPHTPRTAQEHTPSPHSFQGKWQQEQLAWRRRAQHDMDRAIARGTDLLSQLLLLCSDRSGCLPVRAAEPAWRRELRAKHDVRAHKYQLLLSELPHASLSETVTALLKAGYVIEATRVGQRLVEAHHVDLHYYSLTLLGSLYQAMQLVDRAARAVTEEPLSASSALDSTSASSSPAWPSRSLSASSFTPPQSPPLFALREAERPLLVKPEVLKKVRALYERRERVFGGAITSTDRGDGASPADALAPTAVSSVLFHHTSLSAVASSSPAPSTRAADAVTDLVVDPATSRALATVRVARACGVREGAQPELLNFVHQLLHRSTMVPGGALLMSPMPSASSSPPSAPSPSAGVWVSKGHITHRP